MQFYLKKINKNICVELGTITESIEFEVKTEQEQEEQDPLSFEFKLEQEEEILVQNYNQQEL